MRYERGTSRREEAAVQRATGVGAPKAFAPRTRVLTIRDGQSVADTVRELRARPEVATAAPNARAHLAGFIPRDPGRAGVDGGWQELQWNFLAGAGVNAPDAWQHLLDVGRPGGRGAVVAVLDTGVAYSDRRRFRKSTDFSRGDFVRGYDFVDDDRFPHDENGHGTHVASTIGESTHNDRGVTGLAYGAKIMPVRVLNARGEGESAAITAGIRFAVRHGADVINLSFEFDDTFRQFGASEIPDVLAAVRFAARRGVVVVAAAGNFERAAISYPARAPDGDRGRRDDRARLPRPLLERRPRARPRGARRRAGRPRRRDVPEGPAGGARHLPDDLPVGRPAERAARLVELPPLRPAERLHRHLDGGPARVGRRRAGDRLGHPRPGPDAAGGAGAPPGHGDRRRRARLRRGVRLRPARRRRRRPIPLARSSG